MWLFFRLELSVEIRLLRLLRLVRLVKIKDLLRIEHVVDHLFQILSPLGVSKLQVGLYFRLFFLVCIILFATHFLGCVWLLIGRQNVLSEAVPTGWQAVLYSQDTYNHTRDFVACVGGDFSPARWNSVHGSSCNSTKFGGCVPIPADYPYDVDCSWIKDRAGDGAIGSRHCFRRCSRRCSCRCCFCACSKLAWMALVCTISSSLFESASFPASLTARRHSLRAGRF